MEKRRNIVLGKSRCLQPTVSKCSTVQAGTLRYFISQIKPAYLLLIHALILETSLNLCRPAVSLLLR